MCNVRLSDFNPAHYQNMQDLEILEATFDFSHNNVNWGDRGQVCPPAKVFKGPKRSKIYRVKRSLKPKIRCAFKNYFLLRPLKTLFEFQLQNFISEGRREQCCILVIITPQLLFTITEGGLAWRRVIVFFSPVMDFPPKDDSISPLFGCGIENNKQKRCLLKFQSFPVFWLRHMASSRTKKSL